MLNHAEDAADRLRRFVQFVADHSRHAAMVFAARKHGAFCSHLPCWPNPDARGA